MPGPALLATAGWILCGIAFWMLLADSLGHRGPSSTSTWGYILGAVGLACHVAAIVQSLLSWRHGGGVPGVALSYLALPVLWAAWSAYNRCAEARLFRDNPGLIWSDPSPDGLGLDVRDASGVWHVLLDACPNALNSRDGLGTSGQEGVVEVLNPDGTPYMRLHVAERRVECLPGRPRLEAPR